MRSVALALTLAFALGLPGCDDGTAAAPADYAALLAYLGDSVITPEHAAFAARADDLADAAAALEADPTAKTLADAQAAWRAARAAFRRLDALHFGPIADDGISERIDVAPASSTDIDAILAGSDPLDEAVVADAGGQAKGFLGVEYLLFSTDGDAAAFAALTADDGARRCTLAKLMADEIAASAHQLDDAWSKTGGDYIGEFEDAGSTSTRYPTQRGALDDIVGSVGYAWEEVVGVRLAEPLGRKGTGTPDASLDPTLRSDSAAADMQASMDGVSALYGGQGFSARVRAKSAAEDDLMASQIAGCTKAIGAIPPPFGAAVVSDTTVVQGAYDACKAGKATWNTDITSALGATLRPGDNDGD